ncbi:MAG: NADH-quinone oxidoreductase subunit N [Desulfobacteraceae bacterium]|nr:MAG: NADH-quinone oxidoreductase subunit N [Desulfobacteraceae bacterium]
MNYELFLPEIYLLLTALVFFCQSLWKSSPRLNQGIALILSGIGVIITVYTINLTGELFYNAYRIDLFSQIFKCLISLGLFLIILIGQNLKSIEERFQPEFFMFLSICSLGLMMMVSSIELLTLFIAMELSSYSLYILIPVRKEINVGKMEAAIKYILFGAGATGIMLFGMSYLFGMTHSTYMVDILKMMPELVRQPVAVIGILFILCGFFFKLAVVPFHFWTPDVYEGAANITVSFIATMPKLAAMALLLRVVSLAGAGAVDLIKVLVLLAVVSMTFGNLAALVQKDFKRLLAYSSIAHAGYVILGALTMNTVGFAAAVYHITAYLLMNLACFLVLCSVSRDGENVMIKDLSGLHRRSPLLAFTLAVGAFALAGIPPTAGFTGKFFLFTAALSQGHLALVIIAAVNTAISIFYYLNIVRSAYGKDPDGLPDVPLSFSNRLLNYGLIMAIILMGALPTLFIELAKTACETIIS